MSRSKRSREISKNQLYKMEKKMINLQELAGTVGGLIAVMWKPDFSKCLFPNKKQ